MNSNKLNDLQIQPEQRQRPKRSLWTIFLGVLVITGVAIFFAWSRASDDTRVQKNAKGTSGTNAAQSSRPASGSNAAVSTNTDPSSTDDILLTVSGYIINRERIEISPRFLGTVTWIGVKKGDPVTNGQVVVRLDDSEYKARLHEIEGRLDTAKAGLSKAKLDYDRIIQLNKSQIESKKSEDDARIQVEIAEASVKEIQGGIELINTYINWTVIRSPINGVVLEKLVEPNELVVPQSFGGGRGPSTALIAVADPRDLQVEIDLNERDLSKITMGHKCRISPQAFQDKVYEGHVAEIAPEADRSKGTLQIKVQIHNPDQFLTPNLSAKVDFLRK